MRSLPVVSIEPAVDEEVCDSVESHEDMCDIGDAEEPEGWEVEVVATDGFLHIEHLEQVDQAAGEVASKEHHNDEHKHQGKSHVFGLWRDCSGWVTSQQKSIIVMMSLSF